jgi:hypothetical protein
MTPLHFEQVGRKPAVWSARAGRYEFRVRHEGPAGGHLPYRAAICRRAYEGHHHQLVRNELLFARFVTLAGAKAWLEGRAQLVISAQRGQEQRP